MESVLHAYDMAESFFSTLKAESLSRRTSASQADAHIAYSSYIDE